MAGRLRFVPITCRAESYRPNAFVTMIWSECLLSSVSTRGQKQQPRVSHRPGGRRGEGEEDCGAPRCGLHPHHHLPAGAGGHSHLLEVSAPTHTHKISVSVPSSRYWKIPACHRNCFQPASFYADESASPKVMSAPSTPLLLATGITHTTHYTPLHYHHKPGPKRSLPAPDGHEPLTVKQFVKHVMELHTTNTFSKEFEVRQTFANKTSLEVEKSYL